MSLSTNTNATDLHIYEYLKPEERSATNYSHPHLYHSSLPSHKQSLQHQPMDPQNAQINMPLSTEEKATSLNSRGNNGGVNPHPPPNNTKFPTRTSSAVAAGTSPVTSHHAAAPTGQEQISNNDLTLPERCVADVCLIPIGTGSPSVSTEVAEVSKLFRERQRQKGQGAVEVTLHSAGTTLEGSWTDVMTLIGQAHTLLHRHGVLRIQSDIRMGTRMDKKQTAKEKVDAVERLLARTP